jgi:hypothetical protein
MIGGLEIKSEAGFQWESLLREVNTVLTETFASPTHVTLEQMENGQSLKDLKSTNSRDPKLMQLRKSWLKKDKWLLGDEKYRIILSIEHKEHLTKYHIIDSLFYITFKNVFFKLKRF